jgi:hypothetical protein
MIDLGPKKDIITEAVSDDDSENRWYGPFNAHHEPEKVLQVFNKLARQNDKGFKSSVLVGIGKENHWFSLTAKTIREMISKSSEAKKYRNCVQTTEWWFNPSIRLSCWPRVYNDTSLNAENNWGEKNE